MFCGYTNMNFTDSWCMEDVTVEGVTGGEGIGLPAWFPAFYEPLFHNKSVRKMYHMCSMFAQVYEQIRES